MDPNVMLADMRNLADVVKHPNTDATGAMVAGEELAEKFRDLDDWIMRNGFLPAEWHRAQLEAIRNAPTAQG